ncbi:MAG TPA: ATP-binding cassette domain-containing protein, partial [Rhodospirillales bacterium]|nr:ATP-binding cassette domain-containing protein [Rhodospirillales bacterium]
MSLRIRAVSKRFGGYLAIDAVSVEVPAGALYGLIGPNGAGKSTLFAVISGFEKPDHGTLRFADTELSRLPVPARVRLG